MKLLANPALLTFCFFTIFSCSSHQHSSGNTNRAIAGARPIDLNSNRLIKNKATPLENCGGSAYLSPAGVFEVRGSSCTHLRTSFGVWPLKGKKDGQRWIDHPVTRDYKSGDNMFLIGDQKYVYYFGGKGKGDYLTVSHLRTAKELTVNETEPSEVVLEHCLGTFKASQSNDRVVIDLKNVGCSKFDIVRTQRGEVDYEMKPIPVVSFNEGHSGSFTIPQKFIERGSNTIQIRLSSPLLREELIDLKVEVP